MAISPKEALELSVENHRLVSLIEALIDQELVNQTKEPQLYANGSFEIRISGNSLPKPFAEITAQIFHTLSAKYIQAGWKTMLTTVLINNELLVLFRA